MYLAFAPLGLAQQGPFTIRRGRVGAVAIGASAQVIYEMFPADRRRLVDLQLEGELTTALELTLPGSGQRGGVVAELAARNRLEVSRIWITAPAVRTEKGIGVGSAVTDPCRLSARFDFSPCGAGLPSGRKNGSQLSG